jgi:hypothetical protein
MRARRAYMAHPYSGDRAANLARALRWLRWLVDHCPRWAIAAPWIAYAQALDDTVPEHRERAMRDCLAWASDEELIILVGGRVSDGMQQELDTAAAEGATVCDLTFLGEEPPTEEEWAAIFENNSCDSPIAIGVLRWAAP